MYNSGSRGNAAANVAHNWAHKKESQFKKDTVAGSLYYEGDTIYSYGPHFPIAKHITGKDGYRGILFTTRGYSNTTAKHISAVRSACSHFKIIYCEHVPSGNWSIDHNKNFEVWVNEIKTIAQNLPRATTNKIIDSMTNAPKIVCAAPLWQQAIDWLRETKFIHLCYNPHFTTSGGVAGYMFDVYSFSTLTGKQESERTITGPTYQEAREAAILKALELITK